MPSSKRYTTYSPSSELEEKNLPLKIYQNVSIKDNPSPSSSEEIVKPKSRASPRHYSSSSEEIVKSKSSKAVSPKKGVESRFNKIPSTLLSKMTEFLTFDERKTISLIDKGFRKINRDTFLDLSPIPLGYSNLIKFLEINPDLKITGLNIILDSSGVLDSLNPYLKNIQKLVVTGKDSTNKILYDLNFLENCKKLEDCDIRVRSKVLPYLINNHKLKRLSSLGTEDNLFTPIFNNLEYLCIRLASGKSLNLKGCPTLTELDISMSNFGTLKLRDDNKINNLNIKISPNLDLSFLSKCNNLYRLYVEEGEFDLNLLNHMNLLTKLIISGPLKVTGDFGGYKSLRYLKLDYDIRNDMVPLEQLPRLPPNLEHLNLYIDNDNYDHQDPSFRVLSKCPKLEKLTISGKNINLNVKDIKDCKLLKYIRLNLISGSINAARYLAELPQLTILQLRCSDPNLDRSLRLKHCKKLKSVDINMHNLTSLSFLKHCESLNYLYISTDKDLDIKYLEGCTNLKNLYLGSISIINYDFLPRLDYLENLFIYNTEIKPSIIEKLKYKLKPWNSKDIVTLREENGRVFETELEDATIMDTPE